MTIGQVAPSPSSGFCTNCTNFQYAAAPGVSYVVPPGNWSLTNWSVQGGPTAAGVARARVFRPTAVTDRYTVVAETADETAGPVAVTNFAVVPPLAVEGGDVLGIRTGNAPGDIAVTYSAAFANSSAAVFGDPTVGQTVGPGGSFSYGTYDSQMVNVQAILYQGPPETTIVGHPPSSTARHRARFSIYSDAPSPDFGCRLDHAAGFTSCASPQRYRHLSPGRHVFRVRTSAVGMDDPTPAIWRWRIAR